MFCHLKALMPCTLSQLLCAGASPFWLGFLVRNGFYHTGNGISSSFLDTCDASSPLGLRIVFHRSNGLGTFGHQCFDQLVLGR